ncbi:MAG TPA: PEP-CTERM sorting domain-containing protein [Gemmatimonadaceae bacterium]|nr:PEP-CTERM sorting domain-containing protein [Gemmatimonadaceae bacterium]
MNRSVFTKATFVATLAVGAFMAPVSSASAQDRLNFEGSANLLDQPGSGGVNLLIDFLTGSPPTVGGTPTGTVTVVPTTTIPGIANGSTGIIQDLVSSPTSFVGLPIANFLTVGGYTFSLQSAPSGSTFGPITLIGTGTGTIGFFGVRGTVTGGAYGTTGTTYQGVFTAQFAGLTPTEVFARIDAGGTLPVSFSAEFVTASVIPEPSTYALMATGLGFLGFVARRRRTQA